MVHFYLRFVEKIYIRNNSWEAYFVVKNIHMAIYITATRRGHIYPHSCSVNLHDIVSIRDKIVVL